MYITTFKPLGEVWKRDNEVLIMLIKYEYYHSHAVGYVKQKVRYWWVLYNIDYYHLRLVQYCYFMYFLSGSPLYKYNQPAMSGCWHLSRAIKPTCRPKNHVLVILMIGSRIGDYCSRVLTITILTKIYFKLQVGKNYFLIWHQTFANHDI